MRVCDHALYVVWCWAFAVHAQISQRPAQTSRAWRHPMSIWLNACGCSCLSMLVVALLAWCVVFTWCVAHHVLAQYRVFIYSYEACQHVDLGSIHHNVPVWCA
jgi:hypothetical protein